MLIKYPSIRITNASLNVGMYYLSGYVLYIKLDINVQKIKSEKICLEITIPIISSLLELYVKYRVVVLYTFSNTECMEYNHPIAYCMFLDLPYSSLVCDMVTYRVGPF